jgi:hypothetical protein
MKKRYRWTVALLGLTKPAVAALAVGLAIPLVAARADTKQITLPCRPDSPTVKLQPHEERVVVDVGGCVCAESVAQLRQVMAEMARGSGDGMLQSFSAALAPGESRSVTLYCVTRGQLNTYLHALRPRPPSDPAQGGYDQTDSDGGVGGAF